MTESEVKVIRKYRNYIRARQPERSEGSRRDRRSIGRDSLHCNLLFVGPGIPRRPTFMMEGIGSAGGFEASCGLANRLGATI